MLKHPATLCMVPLPRGLSLTAIHTAAASRCDGGKKVTSGHSEIHLHTETDFLLTIYLVFFRTPMTHAAQFRKLSYSRTHLEHILFTKK